MFGFIFTSKIDTKNIKDLKPHNLKIMGFFLHSTISAYPCFFYRLTEGCKTIRFNKTWSGWYGEINSG